MGRSSVDANDHTSFRTRPRRRSRRSRSSPGARGGCAREAGRPRQTLKSAEAAPAGVDVHGIETPAPTAPVIDASAPAILRTKWRGTYAFTECGDPGSPGTEACVRYRVVVDKCPGPCIVHIEVDGPTSKRRLEGVGRATANPAELAAYFTGYGADDAIKTGLVTGSVLLTLEFEPGDHMTLRFGTLRGSNGIGSLITRLVPPHGPR